MSWGWFDTLWNPCDCTINEYNCSEYLIIHDIDFVGSFNILENIAFYLIFPGELLRPSLKSFLFAAKRGAKSFNTDRLIGLFSSPYWQLQLLLPATLMTVTCDGYGNYEIVSSWQSCFMVTRGFPLQRASNVETTSSWIWAGWVVFWRNGFVSSLLRQFPCW